MTSEDFEQDGYKNWVRGAKGLEYLQEGLCDFVGDKVKQCRDITVNQIVQNLPAGSPNHCIDCTSDNLLPDHCIIGTICRGHRCIQRKHNNCFGSKPNARRRRKCPNGICSKLYDAIVLHHSFNDPLWANTDPTTWCLDPLGWSYAKCFEATIDQESSANTTHAAGLLSIIISNKEMWQWLACSNMDSQAFCPFHRARNIRNLILHSSKLVIEDPILGFYLNTFISVLQDRKCLINSNGSKAAVDKILQLQSRKEAMSDKVELPREILNMDSRAIKLYTKALREGETSVRHIRLMIVGHYGAGKTTLAKRLFGETVDIKERKSTNGIDVHVGRRKVSLKNKTWLDTDGQDKANVNSLVTLLSNSNIEEELPGTDFVSDDHVKAVSTKSSHDGQDKALVDKTSTKNRDAPTLQANEILHEKALEEVENDAQNDVPRQHLQELIKETKNGGHITDNDHCDLSVWDFAGQSIFHATHQAFLSRRAIYLLVFDISKEMTEIVEDDIWHYDCQGNHKCKMSDVIKFWLNSIHEFCSCQEENGPPVILVGTFANNLKKRSEYARRNFSNVRSSLQGDVDEKHLTDTDFDVDNSLEEDEIIEKLRKYIVKVATEQRHWVERIPARWITLERSLIKLQEADINVIKMEKLYELNSKQPVRIKNEEELDLFLKFHHETGTILYFGDDDMKTDIVLRPQWLIDAFKTLITDKTLRISELRDEWIEFNKSATLKMDLITQIWERTVFLDNKDLILKFMEKLGFIARPNKCTGMLTEAKDIFLVPCMFKNKVPETITTLEDTEQCKSTSKLCLTNADDKKRSMRYIPSTAFNKLLAACINQWDLATEDGKYMIFRGGAEFKLEDDHFLFIFLYEHVIQIWISRISIDGLSPNRKLCLEVKDKIETILKENVRMQREILSFVKCPRYTLYSNANMDHPLQLRVDEDNIRCFCRGQVHLVPYACLASWWLPEDPDQEWPNVAAMTAKIKVASCTSGHVQRYLNSHEVYPMTKCSRGRCLILSNKEFLKESNLSDRQGTEKDVERTEELFKQLHFDVFIHQNLTAEEIKSTLSLEAKRSDHNQAECFVCVICSHGSENGVFGTDGNTVSLEEITTCFDGRNCKDLQSKPKLFFIQACQGGTIDRPDVDDGGSDRGTLLSNMRRLFRKTVKTDTTDDKNTQQTEPTKTDILIACATHPGYVSIRNINYGSWFIQAVIDVFQKYACREDISDLLTRVNNLVSRGRAELGKKGQKNAMQASNYESSLRKKLFFFPGHVSKSDA